MIAFWLIAAAMIFAALAVILPSLLPRSVDEAAAEHPPDESGATVGVYRERLANLQREHDRGHSSEADFAAAREELKRELLLDVPDRTTSRARGGSRATVALTAVGLPVLALGVYAASGRPDLLAGDRSDRLASSQVAQYAAMQPSERIPPLEAYVADHPDAPRAWSLLGDAYRSQDRFREAVGAFGRARETGDTEDARLIARQAEALLLTKDRQFTPGVEHLIEEALRVDPRNPLGLMLAGHAAFTRGDAESAASHWQRLAEQIPEDDRRRQLVEGLIARARDGLSGDDAAAGGPADAGDSTAGGADGEAAVTVRVRIGEALAGDLDGDSTVFVFAHRVDGAGGPPLAAQRTTLAALPSEIELTDAQAMMPNNALSSADRVVVTARVSASGDVAPRSGDLEGHSEPVATDHPDPIDLTIDHRLE